MPELLLISLLPSPVGDFWMTYALLCLFPQVFINANLIFQEIFSLLLLTAGLWLPFFFPTHVRPGWFSRMPASFISVRADEQNQACWLPFLACSSRERSTTKCSVGQVTDIHPSHSHWGGQALLSCCLYPSWPEQPAANTGTGECLKAKRTNTLSLGNLPSLAYALGQLQSKEKKRGGWHLHSKDWWGKLGLQKWSSLDCAWTFSGCLSPTVKMYMSIPAWYFYRKHFDRIYGFLKNYSHVI